MADMKWTLASSTERDIIVEVPGWGTDHKEHKILLTQSYCDDNVSRVNEIAVSYEQLDDLIDGLELARKKRSLQ